MEQSEFNKKRISDMLKELTEDSVVLNEWEAGFIYSLINNPPIEMSEKQVSKIESIYWSKKPRERKLYLSHAEDFVQYDEDPPHYNHPDESPY